MSAKKNKTSTASTKEPELGQADPAKNANVHELSELLRREIKVATLALLADAEIGRGATEVGAMLLAQKRLALAAAFLDHGAVALSDQAKSREDLNAIYGQMGLHVPMGYAEFIASVASDNGPKTSSAMIDRWLSEKYPGDANKTKELLREISLPCGDGTRLAFEHRKWRKDFARDNSALARETRAKNRELEKPKTTGNKKIRPERKRLTKVADKKAASDRE